MYKNRALVLGCYLSLLALAACWPKVIDDSDLVSVDYKYTFEDWTVIEQWTKEITIWNAWDLGWMESIIRWAKQDDEFVWKIDWNELYEAEYDLNKIQSYPAVVVKEAMQVADPKVWTNVEINSMWHGVITSIEKSDDWYDEYVVNFNDPKTYSELSYLIKVTNIEKK
jgi:hypothetical protein